MDEVIEEDNEPTRDADDEDIPAQVKSIVTLKGVKNEVH